MSNNNDIDSEYQKLKDSAFKQQKLPAWRPVPTITSTSVTFLLFGVAFIIIGAVVLSYSNKVVEVSQSYESGCTIGALNCRVTINIPQDMEPPVMVYYQLNNFYQNHRRYVKSKSNSQLNGQIISKADLEKSNDCDPVFTMKDLGWRRTVSGIDLPEDAVANPCGLIAKSFFNDTYKFYDSSNNNIKINESNIAWEADEKLKYERPKNPNNPDDADYWKTIQWIDVTDPHFMVWMRPAGLPNFRKLWGRINEPLKNGTYTMMVNNSYDVSQFKGQKLIVLSTVNGFGGKNSFLGISYIVVGSICVLMAIAFVIGYKIHNQKKEN